MRRTEPWTTPGGAETRSRASQARKLAGSDPSRPRCCGECAVTGAVRSTDLDRRRRDRADEPLSADPLREPADATVANDRGIPLTFVKRRSAQDR